MTAGGNGMAVEKAKLLTPYHLLFAVFQIFFRHAYTIGLATKMEE